MDGKNFKVVDEFAKYFTVDDYGSYIPSQSHLHMDLAEGKLIRQLNARTGFYERLAEIVDRTDVRFTNNPHGNGPVLGVGLKKCGKRPLSTKRGEVAKYLGASNQTLEQALESRERKFEHIHNDLFSVYKSIEPTISTEADSLLYQVEGDQVMTGGPFDGNHIGEVHKSGLNFIINSSSDIGYANSEISKIVVRGALWLRDLEKSYGMREGTLEPMGATQVRAEQDHDGMFGYPVYCSGNDALDVNIAKRLLIEYGVDTSRLVGTNVTDITTHNAYDFRVIDAAAYILDNKVFTYSDILSIVLYLARIQKHGWKIENGVLVPKDGKTRSVYVNAFIPAVIEGMIFAPFNDKLKELHAPILPSLQDKPTRVGIVKKLITDAMENDYDYLAADWSKYDSSVKGAILATVIQLAVKPFFNAKYYGWVDVATYILTYKYLVTDTNLDAMWADEFVKAKDSALNVSVKNYTIFGLVDGLISGAKFTHVGGSLYGEVVIHYGIGSILGWIPIAGPQAGDDTLMGTPKSFINVADVHATYDPIEKAAAKFGLQMNVAKQMFHSAKGEVVKVFLQDVYHYGCDLWGIGSIFRPADAIWYSERDKGLSVYEQLIAEISRMNNGADSPFVDTVLMWWLSNERYLAYVFKEFGVSGYRKLIDAAGGDPMAIAERIDVGSFSFGVSREDMKSGNLAILEPMARVASQIDLPVGGAEQFLAELRDEPNETEPLINPESEEEA